MARPVSRSAATTVREVKVVFSRLRRRYRGLGLTDDLSGSQAGVLTRLHQEGPSSASVLASAETVSHQTIGAILAVLKTRGFIQRSPDPTDGRRQLISLTAAGVAQAENTTSAREEWLARALQDRLTEDERRLVRNGLDLLNRLSESDSSRRNSAVNANRRTLRGGDLGSARQQRAADGG
jgi:DNA-binding MarR family transcriptional regulator